MDYKNISIENLDTCKRARIPCMSSNIHTIGALVDAMNDVKHAPLNRLNYADIQILVEAVEDMGIKDIQIYPIHLGWYYPTKPVKAFNIEELPNNTEFDELDILPRLKNTYKLAGIFTVDDLEEAFKNPDFGPMDYFLWKDVIKTENLLKNMGKNVGGYYPEHLIWETPKEDRTRYKISPNAPVKTESIRILRLSSRAQRALENAGIYTIEAFLNKYEKDSVQNINGFGPSSWEETIRKFHDIGFYL